MARKYQIPLHRLRVTLLLLAASLCLCLSLACCTRSDRSAETPSEKVTIAIATLPEVTLAQIAHAQGFFRAEGLQETAQFYPYGKIALQKLLEGKADFATVAETPVMFAIMRGEKISILATIVTLRNDHVVVARKDHGVAVIGDLRGKKVATTRGTSAEFFLDAMLVTNGISKNEVQVVDLPADKIADALARGEIDAACAFTPFSILARKKLGNNAVVFSDKEIYRYTFNIVAAQEYIRKNPEKVRKVLRALVKAEDYVEQNPEASQKVVAQVTGVDREVLREIWSDARFAVSLDQPLILALEDESDWAIKNRLTSGASIPNYLSYIYLDGLLSVKPKAVRILK